jgi:molecular chaperone DnaK
VEDANLMRDRVESVTAKVDNPKLEQAREKLDQAASIQQGENDPETCKQAMDNVLDAKKLLAQVRKEHLKEIRQLDLDRCVEYFHQYVRQYARPTEASSFDNLARTAQRAIESNSMDFENHLDQLRSRNFQILWRQDSFVVNRFRWLAEDAYLFPDKHRHAELVVIGQEALRADDMQKLRQVVVELDALRIGSSSDDDVLAATNIVRG